MGLAETLAGLPDNYRIISLGQGHLVVGPTGMCLVGDGERNLRSVARRLAALARRCRYVLAGELEQAPFVDVLVVASGRGHHVDGASVVSPHMLIHTLTAGPAMLNEDGIARVARAVEARRTEIE